MLKPRLTKPFIVSALGSLSFHLVFAVTAGAYFLTREPPPEKNEVRVKIIKKERPDRKEMREKKVKPVMEVVPVIQPKEIVQPVTPQQAVQVASVQKQVDVQPVMMESVQTSAAPPKNARVSSHVSSRALTASTSTPRPLRSTPVATVASSGTTVQKRRSNVSVVTVPNPSPLAQPTTVPQNVVTSSRAGIRQSRSVPTIASAPAPKVVTSSTASSGTGTSGASIHKSGARIASVQGLSAMAPSPVVEKNTGPAVVAPKPGPKVAMLPPPTPAEPEIGTDPEALSGYQSKIHRRVAFIAKRYYKRSSARRANKEGKVLVAFTLLRNGEIKDPYIKTPNPHPLINKAALEALKMAAPFSKIPEEIIEDELNLVIPFSFTLR